MDLLTHFVPLSSSLLHSCSATWDVLFTTMLTFTATEHIKVHTKNEKQKCISMLNPLSPFARIVVLLGVTT